MRHAQQSGREAEVRHVYRHMPLHGRRTTNIERTEAALFTFTPLDSRPPPLAAIFASRFSFLSIALACSRLRRASSRSLVFAC